MIRPMIVECGDRSVGEEIIPMARRGESMRVLVESHGDDLHRRTASVCKLVDNGVVPALARLSGAIHGFLQIPTAAAFHETFRRDHCDLCGSRSVEEKHSHAIPC